MNEGNRLSRIAQTLARGTLDLQFAEKLTELIEQVRARQKKGTIVLKIEVEPSTGRDKEIIDDRVWLTHDIVMKPPEPKKPTSLLFLTDSNDLSPHDPQLEIAEVAAHRRSLQAPDESHRLNG